MRRFKKRIRDYVSKQNAKLRSSGAVYMAFFGGWFYKQIVQLCSYYAMFFIEISPASHRTCARQGRLVSLSTGEDLCRAALLRVTIAHQPEIVAQHTLP
jgi:hypothetical protein